MDNIIEFSGQAYAKMIMHIMKHAHNNCGGLLLAPREDIENEDNSDKSKTQRTESNNGAGDDSQDEVTNQDNCSKVTRIIDAIPVGHASHGLAPNMEVAFNSVSMYALQQDLIICGYYHTDKHCESINHDLFSQRITEKICESYPKAVLCFIRYTDSEDAASHLVPYQCVDGKWRKKTSNFKVEYDPNIIMDKVVFTKERLYRNIVDFDDHFNNIALDWTNSNISQRIDHLVANVF